MMASDGDTTPDENPPPSPDISADAGGGASLSFDDSVTPATFSPEASVSRARKRAASSSPTHDPPSPSYPPALLQAASSSGPSSSSSQNPNVDLLASSSRPSGPIIPSTGGASSSSSSAVASAPGRPRMLGTDYQVLREFNYADYVFQNREKPEEYFSVLSAVTDSRVPGGLGLCKYYSMYDVAQTRMRILEATLPAEKGRYFGHFFGDSLSVSQLVDTKLYELEELSKYLTRVGLTSEHHYKTKVKKSDHSDERQTIGCVRFRFLLGKCYMNDALHPSVERMEEVKGENLDCFGLNNKCVKNISTYGPVVGAYKVPRDHHLLTRVPFYDSTVTNPILGPSGKVVHHGVMIVGYGLALHLPSNVKVPYYVFQDNRGRINAFDDAIGRMPCDRFVWAYAPMLHDQPNLIEFRKSKKKDMRMIKEDAADFQASGGL